MPNDDFDLDTWTEIQLGMSNFDLEIDEGLEEKLKEGKFYCQHSAWNFCGYVYFKNGLFWEQVWQYNSKVTTMAAPTLEELMHDVNMEFGSE